MGTWRDAEPEVWDSEGVGACRDEEPDAVATCLDPLVLDPLVARVGNPEGSEGTMVIGGGAARRRDVSSTTRLSSGTFRATNGCLYVIVGRFFGGEKFGTGLRGLWSLGGGECSPILEFGVRFGMLTYFDAGEERELSMDDLFDVCVRRDLGESCIASNDDLRETEVG